MILSPLCASDELQMTAREGKDTSSDSLSATLALRMLFGRVTFFSSAHFTPLAATSLLPSASSPFPFLCWQVKERAGPLNRPPEPSSEGKDSDGVVQATSGLCFQR